MLKYVSEFLKSHWDGHSPLLLGYSGGPDSKALLYALLESGCRTLHLAHVDHGWRPESAKEALELEEEAKSLGIPFHTIRLNLPPNINKEAASREARLAFFRSLFETIPFQALILAHQAGDVAETALKRILEGAHLPFLGGMEPVGRIADMFIWRPFYSTKKEEILSFLQHKHLKPLIDPTNSDPAYLRARMRMEILPFLARAFGKEISENLHLLSSRAAELKAYLEKKIEVHEPKRGPWGLFSSVSHLERLEARYLLQKWADLEKIRLPRTLLEAALDAVSSNLPNRRISSRILIDRGKVFFLSSSPPSWGTDPLRLLPGSWTWGDWKISVQEDERQPCEAVDWTQVWSGRFTVRAPKGVLSMPSPGTSLRHLWNKMKVPAFLRYQVPIVSSEKGSAIEFLTGKNLSDLERDLIINISSHSAPTS